MAGQGWGRRRVVRAALAGVVLGAAPGLAQAQWRAGRAAQPEAGLSPRAQVARYGHQVAMVTDDLEIAIEHILREGIREAPPGVLSRTRAWLLDRGQRAWLVAERAPQPLEEGAAWQALDREAPQLINDLRDLQTPAPHALRSARRLVVLLRRLEASSFSLLLAMDG